MPLLSQLEHFSTPFALLPLIVTLFILFIRRVSAKRSHSNMALNIKWGRDRFTLQLPPPDTALAVIRSVISDYTHLPPQSFKLVHAGAVMRDDNAPLSAYALRPNSTITVIGSADPLPTKPQAPAPATESTATSKIQSELAQVRGNLLPALEAYLASKPSQENGPQLKKEHLRLSELLLQSLLRLDGVHTEPDWESARLQRKEAVNELQMHLDRLDAGKHSL